MVWKLQAVEASPQTANSRHTLTLFDPTGHFRFVKQKAYRGQWY